MFASLGIIAVTIVSALYLAQFLEDEGWEKVPRKMYEFDQLPGEEVLIRGLLEVNERVILAIPKEGKPSLITEEDVDRIVAEGLKDAYDFRNPGWTHRIRLENIGIEPSFMIEDQYYYVIVSSGTEAWRSEDLLNRFVGMEVELVGKWDSFSDPVYPTLSVTQFQPKSIREAR